MVKTIRSRLSLRVLKDNLPILFTGLAVTALMALLYIFQPVFLKLLDYKLYDALFRQTYTNSTTGVPVIVDIDERSLAEFGQYPWPRLRVAQLLEKIRVAGAAAVGIDILFAEPDRTSPKVLKDSLKKEFKVDIEFKGLPDAFMDNDKLLSQIVETGPFVLGNYFNFDPGAAVENEQKKCIMHPVNVPMLKEAGAPDAKAFLLSPPDAVCNLPVLAMAASGSGFFNAAPDEDGVIRKVPLVVYWQGKYYPSLALATLLRALNRNQVTLKVAPFGVQSIRIARNVIKLDTEGQLLVKYRGKAKTFQYISAADILNGLYPQGSLRGKIVFLGTSAAGLKDIRITPLDANFPGVEVHANIVDNILSQDFLYRPDYAKGVELLLIVFVGFLSTLLLIWTKPTWSLIPVLLCGVGIWQGAVWGLRDKGMYFSILLPLVLLGVNFALLTLIKFWREEGHKKFLHATFSSYLSPELIEDMIKNETMPELGGEARTITAYFTDIQGFSSFSEILTAHQLVELLNEYLTAMTDLLIGNKGTLDKYEGDAIIAFFGAPLDVPDHGLRACRVAITMQNTLLALRAKWKEEHKLPDEPERNTKKLPAEKWPEGSKWPILVHGMKMRIGINSGEIVVGNMGSTTRMNYTMMGDSVNLAARLEAGAKQYGIYTAMSEAVLGLDCNDDQGNPCKVRDMVEARFIDNITVVGKSEPVKVYELCALKGQLTEQEQELFRLFSQGMKLYHAMKWDEAIDKFKQALPLERVPDGKTTPSEVFIKRCETFKETPPVAPGEKWDGVFSLTSK